MSSERWRRIGSLCNAALARPAGERAAFVAEACGDDAALRAEVQSLLAGAESSPSFLETAVGGYQEWRRRPRHDLRGERPDHTLRPTALVHEVYLRQWL